MALSQTKHKPDKVWNIPPPQGPGTQYFTMDEESVPELGGPEAGVRHSGVGFEVLLDVRVPQLGREVVEEPSADLLKKKVAVDERRAREKEALNKRMWEINRKITSDILVSAEEMAAWRRWGGLPPSSSKAVIKRKKRKRRKKKLPKTHSSSYFLQSSGCLKDAVKIEYDQRADVLINTHTFVTYTMHDYPLNSVHSLEVAGYIGPGGAAPGMENVNEFIKEKGITWNKGEEIILNYGRSACSLYSDRTHMYIPRRCWLAWGENRHRYVWRLECSRRWTGILLTSSCGPVSYEERVEQNAVWCTVVQDGEGFDLAPFLRPS